MVNISDEPESIHGEPISPNEEACLSYSIYDEPENEEAGHV